jgi:hypothetical protein
MKQVNLKASTSRRVLSTAGKVTVGALFINACAEILSLFVVLFGEGRLSVPLLVISVIGLLMVGLAASSIRWAPLLGGLVVLVTSLLTLSQPANFSVLLHPSADTSRFVNMTIILVSAVVAIAAGIAATMQHYRRTERLAPQENK